MRKGNKLNDLELNNSDIAILTDIACLDPIEFGSGVYQARAMIDLDGLCLYENKSMYEIENLISTNVNRILLFPNPSKGSITLESTIEMMDIEIQDLQGKTLLNVKLNENSFTLTLVYSPGIYLIKIKLEDGSYE